MSALECRFGACKLSIAALCLFLALMLAAAGRAAMPSQPVDGPTLVASSSSMPIPMPMVGMLDCAMCAVAPAPPAYSLACEGKPDEQPRLAWPEQAPRLPAPSWFFDTGDARERWPVRIAFCRWLD